MKTLNVAMWGMVLTLLALSVSSCSIELFNDDTTIRPSTFGPYTSDQGEPKGSRNNPFEIGTATIVGGWSVTVTSVTRNATAMIMAMDSFASAPEPGKEFLLIDITGIYLGEGSSFPGTDLTFKVVGSAGNTFSKTCSYSINSFSDNEETFTNGSITGSECFIVDSNQVEGATISIQSGISQEERVFVKSDK